MSIVDQYKWVPSIPKPMDLSALGKADFHNAVANETAETMWQQHDSTFHQLLEDAAAAVRKQDMVSAISFKKQKIAAQSLHSRPQLGAATTKMLKLDALLRGLSQLKSKEAHASRVGTAACKPSFVDQWNNLKMNCSFAAKKLDLSLEISGAGL